MFHSLSTTWPLVLVASILWSAARSQIVINEVHYDSDPKTEFVEFVELLNPGSVPIDLSSWQFTNGITFTFPAGTSLDGGGYLLLAENPAALSAKFSISNSIQVFQFTGSLGNDGEVLTFENADGVTIDEVDYRSEFPWPISPRGEGASMQLINPALENDRGGAWRGATPTPGAENSVLVPNAPPIIRQVDHTPVSPAANTATTITAKITDSNGVAAVELLYQSVAPGAYLPAYLPRNFSSITGNPEAPNPANPEFENPTNWTTLGMRDDGAGGDFLAADGIFTAQIPGQSNRTLVRYRIRATDTPGQSVRVPYLDDPSLNFAYFVYDGVPGWTASNSVHPDGGTHTYGSEALTALPVYTMITRNSDRSDAYAYQSTGDSNQQIPKGNAGRSVYNWECALVHDGVVYDHVGWRLRQNNDRYFGNGKRSMRFRFQRGNYFQARDEEGDKLAVKWKRMNTWKMSPFGSANRYGLDAIVNSRLWRKVGVECPLFLPSHFRMIDGPDESPDQYGGDFFGLACVHQSIDGRLLEERGLPSGNVYKIKDGVTNPIELQRHQGRLSVANGSDFNNIRNGLRPSKSDAWLRDHVDWDQWYAYHAVVEGIRHYDFGATSTHFKNRGWYFKPEAGTDYGLLRIVPHDHNGSWYVGYHDNQNSTGTSIGTDYPWWAIFDDRNRPPSGTENTEFTREYRNYLRGFRDLLWQEETVGVMIDDLATELREFSYADRDRWTGGPAAAGAEVMSDIDGLVSGMKSFAFVNDTYLGSSVSGGRGAVLDQFALDDAIPNTPTISYSGVLGFPAGGLQFTSSSFSDPQGAETFGGMQWRISEIAGVGGVEDSALIDSGDFWKYWDTGADPDPDAGQGDSWTALGFNESAWGSGTTLMGYGESGLSTTLTSGNEAILFRKTITIENVADFESFAAGVVRDDGVVVYVNGAEVFRNQMPEGPINYLTLANASASGSNETDFQTFSIDPSLFVDGPNVIAVSVHQRNASSGDMRFDFFLNGVGSVPERKFEWDDAFESPELEVFTSTYNPPANATRAGSIYRTRVRHADRSGRWSHWSEPVEFPVSEPDISLYTSSLVISEIMYHPTNPSAEEIAAGFDDDDLFEFVEIRNVGSVAVDLSNVRFTKGIDFDFPSTILAPGDFVLVVNNLAAFEMRYGVDHPVVGEWSGKLDNGGERLKLSFGAGEAIHDFTYGDIEPWPAEADGVGFSLVLADPLVVPDHGTAFHWRTSVVVGGNPGLSDGTQFAGDTEAELLAYASRGDGQVEILSDGRISFSIELNLLAEDLIGGVESSTDLKIWTLIEPSIMPLTASEATSAGFANQTFTLAETPAGNRQFLRYIVSEK